MKKGYVYDTCVGPLRIVESDIGISEVEFTSNVADIELVETALIKETYQQLDEYFGGKRKEFSIPLDMQGTPFRVKTWKALLDIPYGETRTYKQLAIAVGNENASRAVGNANNKNKIAILIPCHRVIGTNGKLVGYAGGLDKKELLLALEKKNNDCKCIG